MIVAMRSPMRVYTGIGSRTIADAERGAIGAVAQHLAHLGWTLSTGAAPGADQAFLAHADGQAVIWLPWASFEASVHAQAAWSSHTPDHEAWASVNRYHPAPRSLSLAARKLMARNWHQVMGGTAISRHDQSSVVIPRTAFIIAMADPVAGAACVAGGTGQACRIGQDMGIPVIVMRQPGWQRRLRDVMEATA